MTMNISKVTKLPPVEIGYIIDSKRPIIPFSLNVYNAGCAEPHAHPRGQLVYASKGTMRVICENTRWIVPDSQAVWIPAYLEHEVYFPSNVILNNLFIDQAFLKSLPSRCTVIQVLPLLRELILKATLLSKYTEYTKDSAIYRLMIVILDELKQAKEADISLPIPSDKRAIRVMESLLANPADKRGWWNGERLPVQVLVPYHVYLSKRQE